MNLFAYGTLLFPEVMELVSGGRYDSVPATLEGYERLQVQGKPFPGIIHKETSSIEGRMYLDLDRVALARVDFFEDDFYQRTKVQLRLGSGQVADAFTYVVPPSQQHVLAAHAWDEQRFREIELPRYLERASRWMSRMTEGSIA